MGDKGMNTKKLICQEAYQLFCEKGYKDVTMKDICERTGLSRGGLYRHYPGTEQIFLAIVNYLMDHQSNDFKSQMQNQVNAALILDSVLDRYELEMLDSGHSLSVAIYEFFSNPKIAASPNSISRQYEISMDMWTELIEYGIHRGEFKCVPPAAVCDIILFSYQGVRMCSRLMPIHPDIPRRIMNQIKLLLLQEREES